MYFMPQCYQYNYSLNPTSNIPLILLLLLFSLLKILTDFKYKVSLSLFAFFFKQDSDQIDWALAPPRVQLQAFADQENKI